MCTYVAPSPALASKLKSPSIPRSSVSASAASGRRGEVDVVGCLAGGVSPLLIKCRQQCPQARSWRWLQWRPPTFSLALYAGAAGTKLFAEMRVLLVEAGLSAAPSFLFWKNASKHA